VAQKLRPVTSVFMVLPSFPVKHQKGDSGVALIEKILVGSSYIFSRFLHILIV